MTGTSGLSVATASIAMSGDSYARCQEGVTPEGWSPQSSGQHPHAHGCSLAGRDGATLPPLGLIVDITHYVTYACNSNILRTR